MKKIKLFIALSILFIITSKFTEAQNHTLQWAAQIGAPNGNDESRSIVTDNNGSSYIIGMFSGTSDFDPSAGVFNLTSNGGDDIFVSKLDKNGLLKWAISIGGSGFDQGWDIDVDDNLNVYFIGQFNSFNVDFDAGPGTHNLNTNGNNDAFICKIDSNGNFVWVKNLGGTSSDKGFDLEVSPSGHIYSVGQFTDSADFDPSTNNFFLNSIGDVDIFISKLDTNGNFIWAKSFGGISEDKAESIVIDKQENVYITGRFIDTVDFDPGPNIYNLGSNGVSDAFLTKLDSNGNFIWAKSFGGSSIYFDCGFDLIIDKNYIYTTGVFSSTTDFDPSPNIFNLTPSGRSDVFVLKLDTSGGFVWVKKFGGPDANNSDIGYSFVLDKKKNLYITGRFFGNSDFDPSTGNFLINSYGYDDVFINKLDSNGNFKWAKRIGGSDFETGYSIAIDSSENLYTTGYFSGTVDFDPDNGTQNITSFSSTIDAFVQKMSLNLNTSVKIKNYALDDLDIYPNPSKDLVYIKSKYTFNELLIIDLNGKVILETSFPPKKSTTLKINNIPNGLYYIITKGSETHKNKKSRFVINK